MTADTDVDAAFTKALPKVELHAHLSGSISRQTLHEIWQDKKHADPSSALPDPLTGIPAGQTGIDIVTFFPLFDKYIYNLITTAPDIQTATLSVLEDFAADGVVYLELRTTPRAIPAADISKQDYISIVLDTIVAHNAVQCALHTTLILSIDRRNTLFEANEVVDIALRHTGQGVVAVDLCGNPLRGDVSVFAPAFARARAGGLQITVHFGEVPASGTRPELETLLCFRPQRLGHVIHVPEGVRREIVGRGLGLELCLSCNVLAKMTEGSFAGHHFGGWSDSGCPVALSTDDVGIFESSLSNEYLLAAEHFQQDRKDLIELSRDAARCIFADDVEKKRIFSLLDSFKI